MGGFGSGRRGGKECTGDMLALDVRQLQRNGRLEAGTGFSWTWRRGGDVVSSIRVKVDADRAWLIYRQRQRSGEWSAMRYHVLLEWTRCNYGGVRAWWRCPAAGCGRRAAILFGGSVFACRRCHQLAYRCQRETSDNRATRKADKLRDRLGWEAGILNDNGGKPKGMHWRTFDRLEASHDASVNLALAGVAAKFGALGE